MQSGIESPCTCDECQQVSRPADIQPKPSTVTSEQNNTPPNMADNGHERVVDVLVHDAPPEMPRFFQAVASPPYVSAPPPGFVIAPYHPPRFPTGGNVEDLLGDVQSTPLHTFIQQNSVFMCNTQRIMSTQKPCCCQKREPVKVEVPNETPPQKSYITEKNIELTYDYPKGIPVSKSPTKSDEITTTTEVASTVVFVERRIPVKPRKFDFFFRSRSAPVGDNEEPIYATVKKLPKRLRRMELANLEKEVAYKSGEPDSSTRTEITLKTDSESQIPPPDDDTSRSEREKSVVAQRPDSPKAKKKKRFSLTFKKRERKRREKKKEQKNGLPKNGVPVNLESDNERLIEEVGDMTKPKHCLRHRPRNTMSSSSSGPRYKRDSYLVTIIQLIFIIYPFNKPLLASY